MTAFVLTLTSPKAARADVESKSHWYGYQTLITDAGALAAVAGFAATFCLDLSGSRRCENEAAAVFAIAAGGLYLFGAPAIHGAHQRWDKAGLSLGLRTLPFLIGPLLESSGRTPSYAPAVEVPSFIAPMVIDAALLGWETTPERPRVSVVPGFDPKSRTGSFVVSGRF